MDNLTHSLIGVAIGRSVRHDDGGTRRALFWTAVLGSNFPDLDFLITAVLGGGKVGYLLHHRGHTHTVLLAPLLGALAAFLGARIARLKTVPWRLLLTVGILSTLLHVAADAANDYGVHPFWPFLNRWFYGDFIFIIEPTLFFALFPLLALEARARWARVTWSLIGAALLALIWFGPFVPRPIAGALTAWGLATFLAQRRFKGVAVAWAAAAVVYVSFFTASRLARSQVTHTLEQGAPNEKILQLALSPAPGNPFCWRAFAATRGEPGDAYVARLGGVSLWPRGFNPAQCFYGIDVPRTAPLVPNSLTVSDSGVHWGQEFRGTFANLRELAAKSCTFRGLLGFARIPFWGARGAGFVAGDLRYDREPELGFAEVEVLSPGTAEDCVSFVPPWEPPIAR